VLGLEERTHQQIVLKVLRLETLAHTKTEFNQLFAMADYLVDRFGSRFGVFKSIVRASKAAVEAELSFEREGQKSKTTREQTHAGCSTEEISIAVPHEVYLHQRLIASEYAEGISFFHLPEEFRPQVAERILQVELNNLLRDQDETWFDPDRHPGNYRIQVLVNGQPDRVKIQISPIDFGQLQQVTRAEKQGIFDLFAISQVLARTGPTRRSLELVSERLSLNAEEIKTLETTARRFFPDASAKPVSNYFALLAAVEATGHEVKNNYFDFVRAMVQLRQYEGRIRPGTVELP